LPELICCAGCSVYLNNERTYLTGSGSISQSGFKEEVATSCHILFDEDNAIVLMLGQNDFS